MSLTLHELDNATSQWVSTGSALRDMVEAGDPVLDDIKCLKANEEWEQFFIDMHAARIRYWEDVLKRAMDIKKDATLTVYQKNESYRLLYEGEGLK